MIGKDDSHLVEPAVNACIAVVTEDKVFSGAQCVGGGGIAGIFQSGQMIRILFRNSIDIEDAIDDLYRISGHGNDPFYDITVEFRTADNDEIVSVKSVGKPPFLKENRLTGSISRCHGISGHKIELHHISGQQPHGET